MAARLSMDEAGVPSQSNYKRTDFRKREAYAAAILTAVSGEISESL